MSFKNKTVIVTGAGQGIGYEIARKLAENGANVILNDIDPSLLLRATDSINTVHAGRAHALAGDCSDAGFIGALVNYATDTFGKLDIVIANAGITLFGDFLNYSLESFNKIVQLNLAGSFFLAQAAAQKMKSQKTGGSILFMSSVTGHLAHKGLVAYGMTKAALEALSRNLVVELSQYGININSVAPGATLTERTASDNEYENTWNKITPNGRVGRVSDVANAVLFLVHDHAKHITGQNIVVDGGWSSIGISPDN